MIFNGDINAWNVINDDTNDDINVMMRKMNDICDDIKCNDVIIIEMMIYNDDI